MNRFKKEWLMDEYSNKTDIQQALNDGYIGKKPAAVLLGIIERAKNPYVTEPSKEDIDLLKRLYSHGKYSLWYIEYY